MSFLSSKVFIIAEMANSHEGDLSVAKEITRFAAKTGANAIKFQKFTADELANPDHENYNLYKKLEMTNKQWSDLIKFAKNLKLKVFVDVFGIKSAEEISKLNVDGYKVHSSDLGNPELLRFLASTKKPILLSTAGCLPNEIDETLEMLPNNEIVLMHGFQGYPTKLNELNLLRMRELKSKYGLPLGLMDHVSGDSKLAKIIPLLGISLGVSIIEKHITLDRSKKGLDYYSALNPDEFNELVSLIRMTETCLGVKDFALLSNELRYRLVHKKNTIAKNFIKRNTVLNEKMFEFKRTKTKQEPISYYDFIGKRSSKNIPKGAILTKSDLNKNDRKVAAVIACRVDSTRLFAKPLQLVGEYRILHLQLCQLRKSKLINDIVLAISENPGNEIFVNFAKSQKLKFVLGDDEDVLKRLIDGAKYVNSDIVFRITPENPFIYWEGIDTIIQKHLEGNFDLSIIENLPLGTGFELINREALEFSHRMGKRRHRSELCTLYINENMDKFKIYRHKIPKLLQRPELRLTVDTPQDLMVVRDIYKSLGNGDKPISLLEIIRFLDRNPQIVKINSDIPIGVSRIWF